MSAWYLKGFLYSRARLFLSSVHSAQAQGNDASCQVTPVQLEFSRASWSQSLRFVLVLVVCAGCLCLSSCWSRAKEIAYSVNENPPQEQHYRHRTTARPKAHYRRNTTGRSALQSPHYRNHSIRSTATLQLSLQPCRPPTTGTLQGHYRRNTTDFSCTTASPIRTTATLRAATTGCTTEGAVLHYSIGAFHALQPPRHALQPRTCRHAVERYSTVGMCSGPAGFFSWNRP